MTSIPPASLAWRLARPLAFALDAERAHELGIALVATASHVPAVVGAMRWCHAVEDERLRVEAFGLRFANPLGLAAGLDKDARAVPTFGALGFGFVEVGTVTPRPQPGNPRPRLFRLPEDGALVNRMGFNSAGARVVAQRLRERPPGVVVGVNLGRNRDTPNDGALGDLLAARAELDGRGDYLVANVSSPNTVGLRDLQAPRQLRDLVEGLVRAEASSARGRGGVARPVLVKLSPDLDDVSLDASVDAALEAGASGIIAVNTTIARPHGLRGSAAVETGGLSGVPLHPRAREVVARVFRRLDGRLPVVGVGGVSDLRSLLDLIGAGATLVQVYTGFVYAGPALPRLLLRGLLAELDHRAARFAALVGAAA